MNILQDILGLFKRNKFTTPKNKDVIYVARNQKQSHIVEPKLDSKVMELKSLKDWVLTGVGVDNEHFYTDTFINECDASKQRDWEGGAQANLGINKYEDICLPFSFKQDVTLKKVHVSLLTGLPAEPPPAGMDQPGYIGLYKFNNAVFNTDYNDILFNFTKVYQDPTKFNFIFSLANATQEVTLSTPQTMKAGEVYVIVVVHEASNTNFVYSNTLNTHEMLGLKDINTSVPSTPNYNFYKDYISLESVHPDPNAKGLGPIPIISGQLPNAVSFLRKETNLGDPDRYGGWKWMTVKNA